MKDTGFKDYENLLKNLQKVEIKVGILADSKNKEGESIADYAIANEYGTDKIPARPFLSSTTDEESEKWQKLIDDGYDKMLGTQKFDMHQHLSKVGEVMTNDIKLKIANNVPPPNAPSTIKRKKSSRTLIDTGAMLQSVNYKIGTKKDV